MRGRTSARCAWCELPEDPGGSRALRTRAAGPGSTVRCGKGDCSGGRRHGYRTMRNRASPAARRRALRIRLHAGDLRQAMPCNDDGANPRSGGHPRRIVLPDTRRLFAIAQPQVVLTGPRRSLAALEVFHACADACSAAIGPGALEVPEGAPGGTGYAAALVSGDIPLDRPPFMRGVIRNFGLRQWCRRSARFAGQVGGGPWFN